MSIEQRAGFSLIEVMVALLVFSLAVLAVLNLSAESTRTASHVETAALAGMVADTVATDLVAAPVIVLGRTTGETAFGGRTWAWRAETVATVAPDLRRIELDVLHDDRVVAHRTVLRRVTT